MRINTPVSSDLAPPSLAHWRPTIPHYTPANRIMAKRLHKTWADYMVIGISPSLIIVMIWSLVVFLLAVLYRGPYPTRLAFIFAMFVMGAVLVTRISIEEGTEYASLFAIPLAVAMGLAAMRFVRISTFSLPMVALI